VETEKDLQVLREAGRINARVHRTLQAALAPGITGLELDELARQVLQQCGATAAFDEWHGFPGAVCISVNHEVGHGIPDGRPLRTGDLVKIDVGVCYEGWHSDAAATYAIGTPTPEQEHLMSVTRNALSAGISQVAPDVPLSNVSAAMYEVVKGGGCDCVRRAFGHGIGMALHEDPKIASFGPQGRGPRLREGMALAIEPVVTAGLRYTRTLPNGWTDVTVDGSLSAHFEHTVVVTHNGCEIVTNFAAGEGSDEPLPNLVPVRTVCHQKLGSLRIRPKTAADEPRILELAHQTMDPILMEAWGRRAQSGELWGDRQARTLVLEQSDDAVAGFVTYRMQERSVYVQTLIISPEYQRCGLGQLLMQEVEALARERGITVVDLWVQVNNGGAIAFYSKLGFAPSGTPYFNTLAMRKELR
jgi:methionine aminopeptidase type I